MSYLGNVFDRSSLAMYGFISFLDNRTPLAYSPSKCITVGCCFFQDIRNAHCKMTSILFNNSPPHFFSKLDQHRSMGLYLLWYGG